MGGHLAQHTNPSPIPSIHKHTHTLPPTHTKLTPWTDITLSLIIHYPTQTHSLTHSFCHSLRHSLRRSSLTPSLTPFLTCSLTHSLTHSLADTLARSLAPSLPHSLTHSYTDSLTRSLFSAWNAVVIGAKRWVAIPPTSAAMKELGVNQQYAVTCTGVG